MLCLPQSPTIDCTATWLYSLRAGVGRLAYGMQQQAAVLTRCYSCSPSKMHALPPLDWPPEGEVRPKM